MGSETSKPQQHDDSNAGIDFEDVCACYEIDEPADCLEEADIVDDYRIDYTPYIKQIETLLQNKSNLQIMQQEIDTFKFQQNIVDDTRIQIGTTNYKKEGHFMIRDGDRCLTNHDGTAMFFECNMNVNQLWTLNSDGGITGTSGECVDNTMRMAPCENPAILRGSLKENTIRLDDGRCVIKGDVRSMAAVPVGSTSTGVDFRIANYDNFGSIDDDSSSAYVKTETIRYKDKNNEAKCYTQQDYNRWNITWKHHDETLHPIAIEPFCKQGKVQESDNGRTRCVNHYPASHDAVIGTCPSGQNILFANKASSRHDETTRWCGDDKGTRAVSTGASCEKHPMWKEPFERGTMEVGEELEKCMDHFWDVENKGVARQYHQNTIMQPYNYLAEYGIADGNKPASFDKWWECRWKAKLHPYREQWVDAFGLDPVNEDPNCSLEKLQGASESTNYGPETLPSWLS